MPPPNPCDLPGVGRLCDLPGDVIGGAAGSAWEAVVSSFTDAVGDATRLLFTFWTEVPTPGLGAADGPVEFLRSSTSWYTGAFAVAGFLAAAARIALTRRGQHAGVLAQMVVRLVAATFLGVPVVTALCSAGDGYSEWVLQRSTDGEFGARVTALGQLDGLAAGQQPLATGLVFVLALAALVASLGQVLMMFVRAGMLVLLTGLLPLAASVSNTEAGKAWFERSTGWLVAFVLYKPAAATVYAAGFAAVGEPGGGVMDTVTGVCLLVLAVATLPALLRLSVPATAAAVSAGGSGGVAAVGGVLATGALAVGRLSTGGGGGEAGPVRPAAGAMRQGPSGAAGPAGAGSGAGAGAPTPRAAAAGPTGGAGGTAAAGAVPAAAAAAAGVARAASAAASGAASSAAGSPASGSEREERR